MLDFDDLLVWWAAALAEPAVRAAMAARFDHVLVDEYQDTNRLQAAILLGLKPDGRGLTVVGDDAQSIYSFRAAEVRNILDFAAGFAPPAEVVTLERNYRSTAPLLAASNAVIALAAERHAKELWSDMPAVEPPAIVWVAGESEQAAWVADRTLALRETGHRAEEPGGAVPRRPAQRRARARAGAAQHPVRQVRRPEVPRGGARQGRARGAALRRQSARRARRLAGAAARAGHRRGDARAG